MVRAASPGRPAYVDRGDVHASISDVAVGVGLETRDS
jgi:hypothetical protein